MSSYSKAFRTKIDLFTAEGGPFLPRSQWKVVDRFGNGDFLTPSAAVATTPAPGSVIYIAQSPAAAFSINIDASFTIVLAPNTQLLGAGGGAAPINVTAGNTLTLIAFGFATTYSDVGGNGLNLQGAGANLTVYNMTFAGTNGATCIAVADATSVIKAFDCNIGGFPASMDIGMTIPAALGAGTIFRNCNFLGATDGVNSGAAWANAPFYHCAFGGGRVNVAFAGGNSSNVDY